MVDIDHVTLSNLIKSSVEDAKYWGEEVTESTLVYNYDGIQVQVLVTTDQDEFINSGYGYSLIIQEGDNKW